MFEIRLAVRIANEALDFDTFSYLAKIALGSENFVQERLLTKIRFYNTCFDANMIEIALNGFESIKKENRIDLYRDIMNPSFAAVCLSLGKYDQCLELINQLRQHIPNHLDSSLL